MSSDRVWRTKRMNEEPRWRNQHISAQLPTLPYVPHVELDERSRYRMAAPGAINERGQYDRPLSERA